MKCVFAGVFEKSSTNYSLANCLERAGCDVVRFPYRSIAIEKGIEQRDNIFCDVVIAEKPDFVLFSKCNTVDATVVYKINKISKTILWYMDSMNSNWNEELIKKIKLCNATVCALWKPYLESKLYARKAFYLQEGFDPEVDKPVKNIQSKYDVSFIGNIDRERKKYFDRVGFSNPSGFSCKHAEIVCASKINLNFVRNYDGCSDRVYKIMAAGGFLLTQKWPNMECDFNIKNDFDTFADVDELIKKINFYLKHEKDRNSIAISGYNSVQKFSRMEWAKSIISISENI